MKSSIFLSLIGMLITSAVFCQSITIYNGGAFSHLRKNGIELLNNNTFTYSGFISFEYLNKKNFYLSSQIGYNQMGGKEDNTLLEGEYKKVLEKWNYGQINTTFRLKSNMQKTEGYIGLGPYLNILFGKKRLESSLYQEWEKQNTNFGIKPEVGINENINNRIKIGINASFYYGLTPTIESTAGKKLYSNSFILTLAVGYKL